MSPETQRIAIAEACGWKVQAAWHCQSWVYRLPSGELVPDPLKCLNAMHEAEMLLDNPSHNFGTVKGSLGLFDFYSGYLSDHFGRSIRATATQRAEAFLKTLGLWKP